MLAETTAAMYERPPLGGLFLPETINIARKNASARDSYRPPLLKSRSTIATDLDYSWRNQFRRCDAE